MRMRCATRSPTPSSARHLQGTSAAIFRTRMPHSKVRTASNC